MISACVCVCVFTSVVRNRVFIHKCPLIAIISIIYYVFTHLAVGYL